MRIIHAGNFTYNLFITPLEYATASIFFIFASFQNMAIKPFIQARHQAAFQL